MGQERDKRDMIASLRPYPQYRDSGVPWLGHTPEHWQLRKLRHCGAIVGGMTPPMNEAAFWGGDVPWITPKDMKRFLIRDSLDRVTNAAIERTALRYIPAGSVLFVVRGMILARRVPIALTTVSVTINQDMKAIVPRPGVNGAFLTLALASAREAFAPLIDESGHGTRRLPTERWRDLPVALPPRDEQSAIAHFVEHVDRLVARYVRDRETLIALLSEEKQAIIHRTVIRGLDRNVRLKPSGLQWFGDVPEHWEVKRAKYLFREIDKRSVTGREELLSVSHITGVSPRREKNVTMFMASSYVGHKLCRVGDLASNQHYVGMDGRPGCVGTCGNC